MQNLRQREAMYLQQEQQMEAMREMPGMREQIQPSVYHAANGLPPRAPPRPQAHPSII